MTDFLQVANRAESTLDGGITDTATSMTVVADNFPVVPFHVTLEDEIVKVTEKAGLVFTIVREQEGTTGAAHADGTAVRLHLTEAVIKQLQDHEDLTTGVHGVGAGTVAKTDDIPAMATPAVVLGSSAGAGSAATVIRSDSTIEAFDATDPSTQGFGDAAAVGTAAKAARRDHKHAMMADPVPTHAALTATHGATGAIVGTTNTQTLTNKTMIATTNVVEEITTVDSSATPAPTGGSLRNLFTVTALAAGATFAAPSGTPANGNRLVIRIKDNGTARSLAWNAIYRAMEFALPTTTVISKTMYLGFIYNSADSKWDMVAINEEA